MSPQQRIELILHGIESDFNALLGEALRNPDAIDDGMRKWINEVAAQAQKAKEQINGN